MCGAEIVPAVMLAAGEVQVAFAFSHTRSTLASAPASGISSTAKSAAHTLSPLNSTLKAGSMSMRQRGAKEESETTRETAREAERETERERERKCKCRSPWCSVCGSERDRVRCGERSQLQVLLGYWGRGRGRGEGGERECGVGGLTELLLSQTRSSVTSSSNGNAMMVLSEGYRYLHAEYTASRTAPAAQTLQRHAPVAHSAAKQLNSLMDMQRQAPTGLRVEEGEEEKKKREMEEVEQERRWEAFFVGCLGVWPHFRVCEHRHWWAVSCRGSSGDCAICKDDLSCVLFFN